MAIPATLLSKACPTAPIMHTLLCWILLLLLGSILTESIGLGLQEPDSDEKQWLITEFRHSIEHLQLPDFMRRNGYALRWLRTYDYDLETALTKFEATLAWRKAHNMDAFLFEDCPKYEQMFAYGIEGYDNEGRPVYWQPGGQYDMRRVLLSGDANATEYIRFLHGHYEILEHVLHELGHDQVVAIYDMAGFNLKQNGCLRCVGVMTEFTDVVESHYPSLFYKAYLVNPPALFVSTIRVLTPFIHGPTLAAMQVYDYDKSKWAKELLEQIPAEQLSEEYGGTKVGVQAKERKAEYRRWVEQLRAQSTSKRKFDAMANELEARPQQNLKSEASKVKKSDHFASFSVSRLRNANLVIILLHFCIFPFVRPQLHW